MFNKISNIFSTCFQSKPMSETCEINSNHTSTLTSRTNLSTFINFYCPWHEIENTTHEINLTTHQINCLSQFITHCDLYIKNNQIQNNCLNQTDIENQFLILSNLQSATFLSLVAPKNLEIFEGVLIAQPYFSDLIPFIDETQKKPKDWVSVLCFHGYDSTFLNQCDLENAPTLRKKIELCRQYEWINVDTYLNGTSLIEQAIENENIELISAILKTGSQEKTSHKQSQLLQLAVRLKSIASIEFFLKNNFNINSIDNNFITPLYTAFQENNESMINYLMLSGSSIEIQSREIKTSLIHIAILNGGTNIAKKVIEKYPTLINFQDNLGKTPLHIAVEEESESFTQFLLEKNFNFQIRDFKGNSVLHLAATRRSINIINLLINKFPDLLYSINSQRKMPYHLAKDCPYYENFSLLFRKMQDYGYLQNIFRLAVPFAIHSRYGQGSRAVGQSGSRAVGQSGSRAVGQSGSRAVGQSGNIMQTF